MSVDIKDPSTKGPALGAAIRAVVSDLIQIDIANLMESAVGLSTLTIPDGINFIRTNGYWAADGKGAAMYRLKTAAEADEPGQVTSNGGSKRWALAFGLALNLYMFGALGVGDIGRIQDTAAIDAAFAYGEAFPAGNATGDNGAPDIYRMIGGLLVEVPPGEFVYDGSGYVANVNRVIRMVGAGPASSAIRITNDNVHLVKWNNSSSSVCNFVQFRDLKVIGGKGLFLNAKTNVTNIQAGKQLINCDLVGFTGVSFGSFAYEDEQWHILDNTFYGGDTGTPIGVMIPPQMAIGAVTGNNFWGCVYDIKAFADGVAAFLIGPNNSFYSASGRAKLADLWIVPLSTVTNAGMGCKIFGNRFSNENYDGSWSRILIAEEDIGVGVDSSEHPHATTASTKYFQGWSCTDNVFQGVGNPSTGAANLGVLSSYTANIGPFIWKNNVVSQWYPYLVMFHSGVTPDVASMLSMAAIELNNLEEPANNYVPRVSNTGVLGIVTRNDQSSLGDIGELGRTAEPDPTYVNCNLVGGMRVDNNTAGALVTSIQSTDVMGGQNAAQVTFGADQIVTIGLDKSKLIARRICWIEFDVRAAAGNSLDAVQFEIQDSSGTLSRTIFLSSDWKRVTIGWLVPKDYSSASLAILIAARQFLSVGTKDSFEWGREAIYMAAQPINYGHLEVKESSWDRGHIVLGTYHMWITAGGTLRIKNGAPTSDADGFPV